MFRYIFVAILCLSVKATPNFNHAAEHSPLDEDPHTAMSSRERHDSHLPYVVDPPDLDPTQLLNVFPSECTAKCNDQLFATLRSALEGSTTQVFREFQSMCRNYETTMRCLNGLRHCSTSKMYNTLTSGLRYMCVEQRISIEELLPCVNEIFPSIQPACERACQTDRMAAGLTVKQLFQEDIKLLKIFDKSMNMLTTNEACRISQCMLRCYKTRMNVRCEGAAGSVLTEGLVRPYGELQEVGSFFSPLVASFVPRECSFLTDPHEMREFRIDPDFDRHVHHKYMEQRKLAHTHQPPRPFVDPFKNMNVTSEKSPLDND